MRIRRTIARRIRRSGPGIQVVGDVQGVLAANIDEPGRAHTSVSSHQHVRVDQRGRRDRADVAPEPDPDKEQS